MKLIFDKTGIVNTATDIIGILNERDRAKAEQRRHEMEMALKTETLCDQICVTEWTHWTPCTARCGGGVKRREREHILPGRCKSVYTTMVDFLSQIKRNPNDLIFKSHSTTKFEIKVPLYLPI